MKRVQLLLPEWKNKILAFSYDDGQIFDRKLVAIFNEYGIKGTFHLSTGKMTDIGNGKYIGKNEIKSLYQGHEVACHTLNHTTLPLLVNDQVIQEILENRNVLERLVEYPVRGFSYPMGVFDERVKNILSTCGIKYARTTGVTSRFDLPIDYYEWKSTCHHDNELIKKGHEFISRNRSTSISLFYVWGHSYEFEQNNNWHMIEKFCQSIQNHPDIWYATTIEIVDYFSAFQQLQNSVDGNQIFNPTATDIYLIDVETNQKILAKKGEMLNLK